MDVITVYQLQIIIKKHHEKFQEESEVRSYEVFMAINNALRKEGAEYQKVWSGTDSKEGRSKDDMRVFFQEVGVDGF